MTSILLNQLNRLKHNKIFELSVIAVIIISALEIGAKTFPLSENAISVTRILDVFITVFFLFELSVRFITDDDKKRFFTHGWNVFDTVVVIISLIPINDSEMALLARLVRVFRVLRMVSVIPELRILINSLIKALPQLGYVILLISLFFTFMPPLVVSCFRPLTRSFGAISQYPCLTLFRVMTFEDWTDVMYATQAVYSWSWVYYLTFIFFTAFAFLNMVIGIVVNVMEEEHAAQRDKDQPTMQELSQQIEELKTMIAERRDN